MKTIVSALVALSVLAGIAAPGRRRRRQDVSGSSRATATEPSNSTTQPSNSRRTAMKIIVSALVALSVLAGIAAAPAAAFDSRTFWDQQDKNSGN